ncbi:MAG: FAD-dependent oxidoreductase [Thermodesulfobacteriota bacterium]
MTSPHPYDLGVIGGGAAGLTVTAGAARLGAKTLLIEAEGRLGGDCLHYGCVPSKTLINTARAYHQLGRLAEFGLPEVTRPPVDFARVADRIRGVIEVIQRHDSVERFCRLGAETVFGRATFVDDHTVAVDGRKYSAGKWVIATGSSPAVPPLPGLAEAGFLTNRELFSLSRLPASLIVLGGGPIAIEMAQAFNRLGSRVEVIQRSGQILSREDRDMADALLARLRREGVIVHLDATMEEAGRNGGRRWVSCTGRDGGRFRVEGEEILVALGRAANVGGLGLDAAGVEHDPGGIAVDSRLRTSRRHIFAAGDITGSHQFTHAAGYEGGVVISNAVFHLPRRADYRWLPRCTYTDPELAVIGMSEKQAAAAAIDCTVWTEEFRDNDRAQAEGETEGRIKLVLDRRERPLGVQILGPRAGELLGEWVAACNGRLGLSTLAAAVHPYPTLAEINKRVAGDVLARKIFSGRVKRALAFFFQLKGRACDTD